jgi:DNA-binding transcriptional LysR family regulator
MDCHYARIHIVNDGVPNAVRNLRSVDLNLLVALDALIGERNVTRAAHRLGLSQPAMSNALRRLRTLLGDEILVRTPTGMEPTARALQIAEPTRQILREVAGLLESDVSFDPGTSARRFTLRMSDLLEVLLLPALLPTLQEQAPAIGLDVVHLSPEQTVEGIEADALDLAVSTGLAHSSTLRTCHLFDDRMVCVMRAGHPEARAPLTLDAFLRLRHVRVSISPTDTRFVDNVLSDMRLSRNVAVNIQHWLVLPQIVGATDLVAVMSERLASALPGGGIIMRDLPFPTLPIAWHAYWHRRHDGNPAHVWLRRILQTVARKLG